VSLEGADHIPTVEETRAADKEKCQLRWHPDGPLDGQAGRAVRVFVFGMRLNRLRGLPRFLWGLRVLRRVLRDLDAHPERGYLAGRVYRTGRTLVAVQYWESFDALDAWARDHRLPHRKPWQRYLREALGDQAMGLWHETYLASPGSWEGVYVNMPPWGLAAGVEAVEMQATRGSARERLRERRKRSTRAAAERTPPPPP
jgi:hypothetical protein